MYLEVFFFIIDIVIFPGMEICQYAVSMIHGISSEEERIKEACPNLQQIHTDRVVLHICLPWIYFLAVSSLA